MNSDRIIGLTTILTNISVVIGLFFLILEINQNNTFLELEKDSRSIELMSSIQDITWQDESISELISLSPSERTGSQERRFRSFSLSYIAKMQRSWADGYYDGDLDLASTPRSIYGSSQSQLPGNYVKEGWEYYMQFDPIPLNPAFVQWFKDNVVLPNESRPD